MSANNPSRRALLGAIASVPAMGAATAAFAVSTPPKVFPNFGNAPAEHADPLADTIAEYRAGSAQFAAIPSDLIDMGNEEDFVMATYGPAFDRLWDDCPPATSLRGVAEAIRFTIESQSICCSSSENTLEAALAFLEREHGL
jgi:hypothetical protein